VIANTWPTARRDAVTEVADWLDVGDQAALILGDNPDFYYNAVLTDPPDVDEWREVGRFELVFEAEPYSYDINPTGVEFNKVTGNSWTQDFGLISAVYPIIEVENSSGGALPDFALTIGGATINYVGSIADDGVVTINSIGMAVLVGANDDVNLTGVYEPTDLIMSGVTGSFPILQPGVNSLSIDSSTPGASVVVRVFYRKRYRY
jgi:phage-related protein